MFWLAGKLLNIKPKVFHFSAAITEMIQATCEAVAERGGALSLSD